MKKSLIMVVISLLLTVSMAAGLTACHKTSVDETETEAESEMVEYYGCPNSLRIRKLNLKKKRVK